MASVIDRATLTSLNIFSRADELNLSSDEKKAEKVERVNNN